MKFAYKHGAVLIAFAHTDSQNVHAVEHEANDEAVQRILPYSDAQTAMVHATDLYKALENEPPLKCVLFAMIALFANSFIITIVAPVCAQCTTASGKCLLLLPHRPSLITAKVLHVSTSRVSAALPTSDCSTAAAAHTVDWRRIGIGQQ